mgnify:CR=1 FL=1
MRAILSLKNVIVKFLMLISFSSHIFVAFVIDEFPWIAVVFDKRSYLCLDQFYSDSFRLFRENEFKGKGTIN